METLREKLHVYIEEYGPLDPKTIALSQELDKLVVKAQKIKYTLGEGCIK